MQRLFDYFVIVGFDYDHERTGRNFGKILQRFPEKDWSDVAFNSAITHFCQPRGWRLIHEYESPTFMVSVLTSIDATRQFCACLSFLESVKIDNSENWYDERNGDKSFMQNLDHLTCPNSSIYAPKCLVVTSRFDFFDIFKNCLGILYSSYVEPSPDVKLEVLVGNLLGNVYVPPPGCPAIRFSLGSFDRQAVQAPLNPNIPTTGVSVYAFFEELGINNALLVFTAAICEAKIIFVSRSYCKLNEACKALEALFYPLRYSHVFIPVLPVDMLEILDAPTPYMIGVHMDHLPHIHFTDGLLINLDISSVEFHPPSLSIPSISEVHKDIIVSSLLLIMKPYVISADQAFMLKNENGDSEYLRMKDEMFKDKCIRAVFLRFFSYVFSGYRSCLLVVRINPKPVIKFHKPKFMGLKKIINDEFINKLFDSMSFQKFVDERGPPYRACDLFDQLCSSTCSVNHSDIDVREIANNLLRNEPNLTSHTNRIPTPSFRKPSFTFPYLNPELINSTIKEGLKKLEQIKTTFPNQNQTPVFVSMGPCIDRATINKSDWQQTRRLEIIKKCISLIFSEKISEAKKMMGAVVHALKYYESARLPFCEELASYAKLNGKSCLTDAQFELLLQLLNSALESESPFDEHGVAYMMLTLATTFHRRLNNELTQFSYTEIQNHAVWSCFKFWELAFYSDVQIQIVNLYASKFPEFENHQQSDCDMKMDTFSHFTESVLKLTASHMSTPKADDQLKLLSRIEEQTVSSLVLHFIQRIAYMKIPLRKTPSLYVSRTTRSEMAGVDNIGFVDRWSLESGLDCDSLDAVSESVVLFARRFVERVCDEGGVCEGIQSDLLAKLYQTIQIQMEELEKISKEVGKDTCCPKPELLRLRLIPENTEHEECLSMRAFLVSDGRDDPLFDSSLSILPAEGSLSLTNYRVIFKGRSVDPRITNEYTLIRWFPIHSLIREKKISGPYRLQGSNICLYNGLQLRSATFQLIKVFFDDEVDISEIEKFRAHANEKRYPECIYHMFCFAASFEGKKHGAKSKDKTLKHYAKSMLKRTVFANNREKSMIGRSSRLMPGRSLKYLDAELCDLQQSDDESNMILQDSDTITYTSSLYDSKSFGSFYDGCIYKDYCRLHLLSNSALKNISSTLNGSEKFKISHVNRLYSLCQSYPAAFVMPKSISDDSVKRFARCYKLNRFPVVVWRHMETNALLLRGSAFSSRSFITALIKGAQTNSNPSSETNVSIEHEKYLDAIVCLTPRTIPFVDETLDELPEMTPLLLRRSEPKTFSKFSDYLTRQSQERLKWKSSAKDDTIPSRYAYTDNSSSCHDSICLISEYDIGENTLHVYKRYPLYIICERSQYKMNKPDQNQSYTLLPVDIHEARHVRTAFRKLLRACIPSSSFSQETNEKREGFRDKSHVFLKSIEESQWFQQIQRILFISNRIVEFMEDHASSVILSLENGWDITSQISSVVQILSDQYYRTIEGFKTLIEREWLSFGHKFTHRSHQTVNGRFSFAPLFLQFLDVVHQILNQFPTFFEYNDYFLKFLAYHYLSGRFKNFTLDSECERLISRNWKLVPDKISTQVLSVEDIFRFTTIDIWEFISKVHRYLPTFYNFMYSPVKSCKALRPCWKSWNLDIWSYYSHESLSCGSLYDLDLKHLEQMEQIEEIDSIVGNRSFISLAFDEPEGNLLDELNFLFKEYLKLELKSKCLLPWRSFWEKVEQSERNKFTACVNGNKSKFFKHKVHQFVKEHVDEYSVCEGCREVIAYGSVILVCRSCRISCHLACENIIGKVCSKVNAIANCSLYQAGSVSDTFDCKPNFANINYRTAPQHKTFEGLLKKRGHLLKQWKERWFVLDSVRHELRYYDSLEDIQVRGVIYLAEAVEVVRVTGPVTGVPKRADASTFFDLKTSKRVYNFIAPSVQQANEWIEKLQACLDC